MEVERLSGLEESDAGRQEGICEIVFDVLLLVRWHKVRFEGGDQVVEAVNQAVELFGGLLGHPEYVLKLIYW